mgnify:CR=1 FL=1
MLLAWIVFALMIGLAIYDIKKAILIWLPCRLLFNAQIALKYSAPIISLDIATTTFLLLFYFIKCHGKNRKFNFTTFDYVFMPIFIAYFLSYFFSFITSDIPINTSRINSSIKFFIRNFGLLYLLQKALNTEKDIKFFIKTCAIVIFFITGLGIFQAISGDNPFLDYVYYNSPQNEATKGRMFYVPPGVYNSSHLRFGMRRICSFFSFHVPFGTTCVFFFYLALTLIVKRWGYIKPKYLMICAALLITGIFLSNSKQAAVGFAFMLLCFIKPKYIFNYRTLLVFCVLAIFLYCYPEYLNNFISLTNEDLAEEGGGSTLELRKQQWLIAIDLFQKNPIFGNGPETLSYFRQFSDYEGILGAESVWLKVLPQLGVFGACVYIFSLIYIFFRFKEIMPIAPLFFFLLSLFMIESGGGQKDMAISFSMLYTVWRIFSLRGGLKSPQKATRYKMSYR